MTDAIVASRKKQIDDIVKSVLKGENENITRTAAEWRLVTMSHSINLDAIMGLMIPEKGVTEEERAELHEYTERAYDRLRV